MLSFALIRGRFFLLLWLLENLPLNQGKSAAYGSVLKKIAREECVILDGGVATELQQQRVTDFRLSDTNHWGFEAINHAPTAVVDVHKRYLDAGCDVITTNTYAILDQTRRAGDWDNRAGSPAHWMDMARKAVLLARDATQSCERLDSCAVAFSIGGDIVTEQQLGTVKLLLRVFGDTRPDFVIFETLSMMSENLTKAAVEMLVESGIPVWLSFRRCRHGVCGIHGQLWGGPEGDYFGRLTQELEQIGASAILVNCLPVEAVSGTLPWLRDFTDLPLGAYPNLGRYVDPGWRFDDNVTPEDYADMALIWRAEGAQILGGCCGIGPDHISAMASALEGTKPSAPIGKGRHDLPTNLSQRLYEANNVIDIEGWIDDKQRDLYPLPLPKLVCEPEVFIPTQGSYLLWKFLFSSGTGQGKRCLDVGCGAGILSVQLALNGAEHVTAIDVQKEAVANTLTNAFRNDVADRVTGEVVDLYAIDPSEKYDVIVASLYQMPVDPLEDLGGHRSVDYWGRNLLDHLISLLPSLLEDDGVAYLMQISLLSQKQTAQVLHRAGLESRVVDFNLYNFNSAFLENLDQIEQVEQSSDAYHFMFRGEHVMVMYLLEIRYTGAKS